MKRLLVRRRWPFLVALCAAGAVVWGFRGAGRDTKALGGPQSGILARDADADAALPRVDVVRPEAGGIERLSVQPGSVHAFESVELFAMVSGYLKSQEVDIGSRVKRGQVLAVIDAPREATAVDEAVALLEQARAHAAQAEAAVATAAAERDTAEATVAQAEADIERVVANWRLAQAQYERVKGLHAQNAVDKRLVDEQLRDLEAAAAADKTARLAVRTAKTRLAGAAARVDQARADAVAARAAVGVAEAHLEKARVDLKYAQVFAPFDGVVTLRGFHPGAFIRSAADGNQPPLLTVARTDLMRVVVRVPDRDVTLTNPGDPVTLTVDGLDGRTFRGKVARVAESEDHTTRTMRVEVDIPNPDGRLRDGMYGRASIGLEPPSRRLSIPSGCVVSRESKGRGAVHVVRSGKVERVGVEVDTDNGSRAEIRSGLTAEDQVVLRSSTPVQPGMRVVARLAP